MKPILVLDQTMAIDKEKWVLVNELTDYLDFCKDTIYTWLVEKDMPALRAGKLWKFKVLWSNNDLLTAELPARKQQQKPERKNEFCDVACSRFCRSKTLIQEARRKAMASVDAVAIGLYWNAGIFVRDRLKTAA